MSSGRMRRVDEAIRQVLGDAVAGELKDPRVGFVTVTDVRTSADLRHARVYVSVLGDGGKPSSTEQREATMEGLRSAHGFLQGKVASELHLKRTPTLELHYDGTTDRAMRVDELIEEIDLERPRALEHRHDSEHPHAPEHRHDPARPHAPEHQLYPGHPHSEERSR